MKTEACLYFRANPSKNYFPFCSLLLPKHSPATMEQSLFDTFSYCNSKLITCYSILHIIPYL